MHSSLSGATKFLSVRSMLAELESSPNYKGFSISFSKILGAIERFTKVRYFFDCSLHHILESENLRFPFSTKNNVA